MVDTNKIPGQTVGRNQTSILVEVPTTAATYTANDAVAGAADIPLEFANAAVDGNNTGVIISAVMVDDNKQGFTFDLILYKSNPAATVDQAIFSPADAELRNIIGVISFNTWTDFEDNSVSFVGNIGMGFDLDSPNTTIYGVLVTRGAYAAAGTDDISLRLNILQN